VSRSGRGPRITRALLEPRDPLGERPLGFAVAGFQAVRAAGGRIGPPAVLSSADRPRAEEAPMPILLFIILVILIAQIGFWDTFAAILGGAAMLVLFVLLAIALVALAGMLMVRRLRR
jgi:hypothetical protein